MNRMSTEMVGEFRYGCLTAMFRPVAISWSRCRCVAGEERLIVCWAGSSGRGICRRDTAVVDMFKTGGYEGTVRVVELTFPLSGPETKVFEHHGLHAEASAMRLPVEYYIFE